MLNRTFQKFEVKFLRIYVIYCENSSKHMPCPPCTRTQQIFIPSGLNLKTKECCSASPNAEFSNDCQAKRRPSGIGTVHILRNPMTSRIPCYAATSQQGCSEVCRMDDFSLTQDRKSRPWNITKPHLFFCERMG